jgi:6-pyruvoyltetrahydropterin/6-carboxytetrahydropterin synthase
VQPAREERSQASSVDGPQGQGRRLDGGFTDVEGPEGTEASVEVTRGLRASAVRPARSLERVRTRVTRTFSFDAAHQLPWHPGKCRNLHGHTYRLEVSVEGPVGPQGIVTDFADIDVIVRRDIIDRFDHVYLNDFLDNPTAELVAADIWKRLEQTDWGLGGGTLRLAGLRLWETPDSSVELFP